MTTGQEKAIRKRIGQGLYDLVSRIHIPLLLAEIERLREALAECEARVWEEAARDLKNHCTCGASPGCFSVAIHDMKCVTWKAEGLVKTFQKKAAECEAEGAGE